MSRARQKFDRQLFDLKTRELSHQMLTKSVASDSAAFRGASAAGRHSALGGSASVRVVDGQLSLLSEWLEGIDRIAREVWQIQGEQLTPEFVRDILVQEALMLIAVREATVKSNVTRAASHSTEDPYPAQHHLAVEVERLRAKVSENYEIEGRTLEHREAHKRKPKLPTPIEPVNTSRGLWLGSTSKPSEVPHDPPAYFPSDLWPQTNVVLLEARRKFPERTQTLELCKHVVAEMTPIFVEAVKAKKIKAGAVQRENGGGMEDLLHSLLVYNDDGIKGGFSSLSDQAYQLGKRVRESNEWAGLAKAIAETKRESTGTQTGQAAPKPAPANTVDDASSRGSGHSPVAFISYSWDSPAHEKWVLDLACRLRGKGGVQIILDQWHLQPGHDRTRFMEESVTKSDFVILICTPDYARKANNREGGVGYEAMIITGELADSIAQGKFIPILRDGDWKSSLPVWIKTKVGVDLRGNPYSDEQYQALLRALHKEPVKPPPVGPKPVFGNSSPVDQEIVPPEWAVRAVLLDEDQSSWPDVILECQWPSLAHEPRISGSHIVRKRPWMLRHGGPGAVYNVCVHDIDFGEYKARFPSVRTLTDTASVHPIIYWKSDGLVIDAHDLESLIHNPPSGCDVQQYAVEIDGNEGEEIRLEDFVLEVEIPVTISYDDKNGNRFKIKYLLHYDTYMEEGEMIRIGRIEKVGPR